MPMYQFRLTGADERRSEFALGFFDAQGALGHARRIARGARVEVWRGDELVGTLEERAGAEAAAPANPVPA